MYVGVVLLAFLSACTSGALVQEDEKPASLVQDDSLSKQESVVVGQAHVVDDKKAQEAVAEVSDGKAASLASSDQVQTVAGPDFFDAIGFDHGYSPYHHGHHHGHHDPYGHHHHYHEPYGHVHDSMDEGLGVADRYDPDHSSLDDLVDAHHDFYGHHHGLDYDDFDDHHHGYPYSYHHPHHHHHHSHFHDDDLYDHDVFHDGDDDLEDVGARFLLSSGDDLHQHHRHHQDFLHSHGHHGRQPWDAGYGSFYPRHHFAHHHHGHHHGHDYW